VRPWVQSQHQKKKKQKKKYEGTGNSIPLPRDDLSEHPIAPRVTGVSATSWTWLFRNAPSNDSPKL
jgi:hypothetical protein